jgi:GT2 family glycosyltransferase
MPEAEIPATPALSVVIPVLNGGRFLRDQLAALAHEEVEGGFEVLVCDNGSTDGSVGIAHEFDDRLNLRVLDASQRRGQTHARNVGAAAANGGVLVFVDQDDVVAPGYLAAMRVALNENELVAARVDTERLNKGWVGAARELAQTSSLAGLSIPWAYGCTLGIRRTLFQRLGGFDTDLVVAAEDIDLCWRAAKVGIQLAFVSDAVLFYRFPDTYRGLFRQGRRYGIAQIALNRKHDVPRSPFMTWLRPTLGALRRIAVGNRGERGRGYFILGRRLGLVEGVLRYRTQLRRDVGSVV